MPYSSFDKNDPAVLYLFRKIGPETRGVCRVWFDRDDLGGPAVERVFRENADVASGVDNGVPGADLYTSVLVVLAVKDLRQQRNEQRAPARTDPKPVLAGGAATNTGSVPAVGGRASERQTASSRSRL